MHLDCDVLVIGAGITGLVAAHRLQRAGRRVCVVEAAARVGGVIGSRSQHGALIETGPNSTLDTTPLLDELLRELGIHGERVDADALAKRRFIVREGKLVALPTSPPALLRSRAFTSRAKLRVLREPFVARAQSGADESIAEFVRRRLGVEFLDYAVDPFVAGIYAGDPEQISVRAAFPRLHALEQAHGSLIIGEIKRRRETAAPDQRARSAAQSFSFRRGMQTLSDGLGRNLADVRLDTRALSISRTAPATFAVRMRNVAGEQTLHVHSVVVATPAYGAAELANALAPDAAAALRAIEYAPVLSVATAYRREHVRHPLDGFGFLVPRVEHRRILGTLFSSSMFAGRAPAGEVLLTTFAGGRRDPGIFALGDDEITQVVSEELSALLGAETPLWHRVARWPQAIPQYALGHLDRLNAIDAAERSIDGLHFAGSYRGGVSVADCIASGHALADRVSRALPG